MSTHEHHGGTATHDPAFDHGDVSELEDAVLGALEEAQAKAAALDSAMSDLKQHLTRALHRLVKAGDIITHGSFGNISVAAGNSRGAIRFEVAGPAHFQTISTHHPELVRFTVEAWPLNDAGKRLSGRAGNNSRGRTAETVTLHVSLCHIALDETASGNDILMRAVARAAERA